MKISVQPGSPAVLMLAHFYKCDAGLPQASEYKYEGTVESIYLIDDMTKPRK